MSAASTLRHGFSVILASVLVLAGVLGLGLPSATAAGTPATASTITAQSPEGLAINVAGSGFSGENPGVYVSLAVEGSSSTSDASQYLGTTWVQAGQIVDGSFAATVSLDAAAVASLDPTQQYVVHTMKAHGQAAADPSQTTATPIALDFVALGLAEPEPSVDPVDPEEPSVPEVPTVTVSQTDVPETGQTTVTVTGSGFDPALATGTRPPLMGKSAGAYVVFGKFADHWRPSEGAASSGRTIVSQKWAVMAGDMATIGGPARGAVELTPQGTFTTELVLDKAAADAASAIGSYGIYTYPGSGANVAAYETATPITFTRATPEPESPQVSAEITSSSPQGLTVQVEGSGFDVVFPGVYVSIGETGTTDSQDPGAYLATAWVSSTAMGEGGTFSTTLELDATAIAKLDPATSYSVITMKAHGMPDPGGTQATDTVLDIDFASLTEPDPSGPSTVSTITAQSPSELSISVIGSGFSGAPPGLYVSLAPAGTTSTSDASQYLGTQFLTPAAISSGGFATTVSLDAATIAQLDPTKQYVVHTMKAHGQAATDPSQTTATPITLDFQKLGVTQPPVDQPDPPSTPPVVNPPAPTPAIGAGYLQWGVKASFRSYVTGIARGSISVSGGAGTAGSGYQFPQRATSSSGLTTYGGAVTFTGHGGQLNLSLADPQVSVDSPARGSLSVLVNGRRVSVASLNLAAAARMDDAGVTTYVNAPATLTTAGVPAFNGFYAAGSALDPVTFAVGSNARGSLGSGVARTVATAQRKTAFVPPATAPATSGLEAPGVDLDAVEPGQEITVLGSGLEPNESGVAVVVYSEPVVLRDDLAADGAGRATWTGTVPATLEPGEHTLTFQGSVDLGLTFTVVERPDLDVCTVSDATLTWGVKESFRAYVSGSIAKGDWTTSGNASYATPVFSFAAGTGNFDPATSGGQLDFRGGLAFSGHAGALDLQLSDPVVRMLDPDTALLVVDVAGTSREAAESGTAVATSTPDVPFAELDLSAVPLAEGEDGVWSASGVPAALTPEGSVAFSTYEAGTELDPVDLTLTIDPECGAPELAADQESASSAAPLADGSASGWLTWVLVGLGVLLVGATGVGLALARRR